MPIVIDRQTTFSITLNDLSEHDLIRIIRDRQAQNVLVKAVRAEIQRLLNMPRGLSTTLARPAITAGGKKYCPICGAGFEPRGRMVHLTRKHNIENPKQWLLEHGEPVKALAPGGAYRCGICGATSGKNGNPFNTEASVRVHKARLHRGVHEPAEAIAIAL